MYPAMLQCFTRAPFMRREILLYQVSSDVGHTIVPTLAYLIVFAVLVQCTGWSDAKGEMMRALRSTVMRSHISNKQQTSYLIDQPGSQQEAGYCSIPDATLLATISDALR